MIVGLTGGIGSGKTTVAKMFKALGVPVYNSDKEAKRLMRSSKKVKKAILQLFGDEAYLDKKLNKTYISSKVFKDPNLLEQLNGIVHPAVRKHFLSWKSRQKSPYVIQEAAIIFEIGSQNNYDRIILVTSPESTRIQRVIDRDGSTREKVLNRINNQWPDEEKIVLADFIVSNTDLEKTRNMVNDIHVQLLKISN
ncbi:dephospho-CoA kinase [Spongiimicrobium sp. 3-5]|uniref:dephospho-CoA kinase n=1 Tax=Spongiimicrobium sp. 3-5 TaxID=3332596 RepID=UPI00397ECE5F